MKAIIKEFPEKGAVLKEYSIPSLGFNEVLVKVKATAICGTDIHIFEWNQWAQNAGIKLPIVLGHECAGEIVEAGEFVEPWAIMSNLLEQKLINIEPIITHVYNLKDFEKGLEIIKRGEGGKVILVP